MNILTGKPSGKGSLGKPRLRWEDSINIDLKRMCFSVSNWIDSVQDRDY